MFGYFVDEGWMNSDVVKLLCYCKMIGVEYIVVFMDIKKKYSLYVIFVDISLEEIVKVV